MVGLSQHHDTHSLGYDLYTIRGFRILDVNLNSYTLFHITNFWIIESHINPIRSKWTVIKIQNSSDSRSHVYNHTCYLSMGPFIYLLRTLLLTRPVKNVFRDQIGLRIIWTLRNIHVKIFWWSFECLVWVFFTMNKLKKKTAHFSLCFY